MDNKQEVEIYPLVDEEGNTHEFALIGSCELKGTHYYAMVPVEDTADQKEEIGYVILKGVMVDGAEDLVSVDDDDEFDDVADVFDDMFATDIDYDDGDQGKK